VKFVYAFLTQENSILTDYCSILIFLDTTAGIAKATKNLATLPRFC